VCGGFPPSTDEAHGDAARAQRPVVTCNRIFSGALAEIELIVANQLIIFTLNMKVFVLMIITLFIFDPYYQ
jgi:hypothetical protein